MRMLAARQCWGQYSEFLVQRDTRMIDMQGKVNKQLCVVQKEQGTVQYSLHVHANNIGRDQVPCACRCHPGDAADSHVGSIVALI
jgi:hypothetical protein